MNSHFIRRTQCPVCHSKNFKLVFSIPYEDPKMVKYMHTYYDFQGKVEYEYLKDADFVLQECDVCHAVFQEYIPNDDFMFRLYETWIDPVYTLKQRVNKEGVDHYKRYAAEITNLLLYFKSVPTETKFMDFGMGWGKWAMMAKAFAVDSYGMELSLERIEYARKHGVKIVDWNDVPNHEFDFINTEQVFEHIPEPLDTMKHLSQGLKKGGIIKISVPNGDNIDYKLNKQQFDAPRSSKPSLMVVTPLEHINCYRTQSILKMGEQCGLKNVDINQSYIGFRSLKDFVKIAFRRKYHRYSKSGDIVLFFQK